MKKRLDIVVRPTKLWRKWSVERSFKVVSVRRFHSTLTCCLGGRGPVNPEPSACRADADGLLFISLYNRADSEVPYCPRPVQPFASLATIRGEAGTAHENLEEYRSVYRPWLTFPPRGEAGAGFSASIGRYTAFRRARIPEAPRDTPGVPRRDDRNDTPQRGNITLCGLRNDSVLEVVQSMSVGPHFHSNMEPRQPAPASATASQLQAYECLRKTKPELSFYSNQAGHRIQISKWLGRPKTQPWTETHKLFSCDQSPEEASLWSGSRNKKEQMNDKDTLPIKQRGKGVITSVRSKGPSPELTSVMNRPAPWSHTAVRQQLNLRRQRGYRSLRQVATGVNRAARSPPVPSRKAEPDAVQSQHRYELGGVSHRPRGFAL